MTVQVGLQQYLQAESNVSAAEVITPHHPVSCFGNIRYHDDGVLECEHAITWPHDARTRRAVDHSMAILLIEIAVETL